MTKRPKKTVFIIDDDTLFADCIRTATLKASKSINIQKFTNPLDAMNALDSPLPDLIFLDILLPGADAFTFLNELSSYEDTAKIPIVIVTNIELPQTDLSIYGVRGILNKETMKPEEVTSYVERFVI